MATLGQPSEIVILEYQTPTGRRPYVEWMRKLKDRQGAAIIRTRLNRVRLGQFGSHRSVGEKVWELKISFGPGYRIYYLMDGETMVILLCGGDKSTQPRDIEQAREFAADYLRRK